MPKTKLYYPLEVSAWVAQTLPKYGFSVADMERLTENILSKEQKRDIVQMRRAMLLMSGKNLDIQSFDDLSEADIHKLDFLATVDAWSENKQVFKIDADFAQTLLDTENLHISKDMWRYLPCDAMYFDLADVPFISTEIGVSGAFVKVVRDSHKDSWELHIFQMCGGVKFRANPLFITNEDQECDFGNATEALKLDVIKDMYGEEAAIKAKNNAKSVLLVIQLLCYLCSVEPDVKENELTKTTYRPRKAGQPVKNKFSEIQKHDVGVRFGTAFRKYKASQASASSGTAHKTGHTKRPHFRKAHWSFYWYNVLDDNGETIYNVYGVPEKVKRPKWLAETFVNEKYGEKDVVIHKVGD